MIQMRMTAVVPPGRSVDDIHWLAIELNEDGETWSLLMFREKATKPYFDSWYLTLEGAQEEAAHEYGVQPQDWRLDE